MSFADMDRSGSVSTQLMDHGVCRAYYRLTDIRVQLTPYVEDVVRSEVPKRTLDEAYEVRAETFYWRAVALFSPVVLSPPVSHFSPAAEQSKEAVALAVKSALSIEMQRYGYEIINALVTDLQPDSNVLSAMNQIEAQRRMRMAAQEKAEADKILIVKAAEADAESKYLSGAGVARQRRAIVDGLKESVMDFNDSVVGTTPTDVMQVSLHL